ncbi:MAG: FAD-binding oxidoreductase [Rhodobacter sp.]|nr:FAD-binding oxidoreductase [Rhodobacter sp.]
MELTAQLEGIVGPGHVLTGGDTAKFDHDWTGKYRFHPLAVVRPASTDEVSRVMRLAHDTGTPVVPVSGNTGLAGGTHAEGALMISLDRMNRVREIRSEARIAVVEAGVILSNLHTAAEAHALVFPLTFGARGSAMIGGALSTNAGGSNVVRYGSTRGLCLGLEVVLADGRVMDLMTELHKDNSGYDLKDLFIGAEGTLGLITAAVVKLFPKPAAYATAMVAAPGLPEALTLLNRLQQATGGMVEAFEYMPRAYVEAHLAKFPDAREPFEAAHEVNIMVEVGATAPRDALPGPDGEVPVVAHLEETLAVLMEEGAVLDAVVAKSEAQRAEMWKRREDAAEVTLGRLPIVNNDIAVPLDKVAVFLDRMAAALPGLDARAETRVVAHLGDGNVHYTVLPASQDSSVHDAIMETVEEVALDLGGSFSAEHGIGLSKKPSMARRKNPVAVEVMRGIKAALDPKGILNPGKVLPE